MPPDPFRKKGIFFCVQLHARLIVRLVGAVARHAHVAGGDALHRSILVEQYLGGREAGEDLDAQRFGLPGQPAAEIAERERVGALVVHEGRHQEVRKLIFLGCGQHPVVVLDHGHGQRAIELLPVRDQLVKRNRIHDRARQDMRADLGALFQHADAKFASRLIRQLLQPDRRSQPRRPRADDHDVVGHRFARCHLHFPLALPGLFSKRPIRMRVPPD
jgi:hypothetical protein